MSGLGPPGPVRVCLASAANQFSIGEVGLVNSITYRQMEFASLTPLSFDDDP